VLITPTKIFCANLGDSRSVINSNGKAVELSRDHKPDNLVEKTRIVKAGGEVVNSRINNDISVSRSFGDFLFK